MTNHVSHLDELLAEMRTADRLYRPTKFWSAAVEDLAREISAKGFERFRSLPGPLDFFVPQYGFPGYQAHRERFDPTLQALREMRLPDKRCVAHVERLLSGEAQAESDYRVLLASDRDGAPFLSKVSESTVGAPLEQFTFDGRRFSRSFLNYLLGLAFLKQHCDTSVIHTVLEIGGGFGSLGEILLGDPRNDCFYVDVDIPPTINVATYYLSTVFGQKAVLGFNHTRSHTTIDLAELRSTHRAATLATWQLAKVVGTVDLFVNFISFQEMEPEVVRNYLAHVSRLRARYVLLRNLREGKAKATTSQDHGVVDPVRDDMYDSFLAGYRLAAANTLPFGYRTVDGFHSELRLYERL